MCHNEHKKTTRDEKRKETFFFIFFLFTEGFKIIKVVKDGVPPPRRTKARSFRLQWANRLIPVTQYNLFNEDGMASHPMI